MRLPLFPPGSHAPFPPVTQALREPNGLLAAGGDLSTERLLDAYRHGIFPWYSEGELILWWSPDPRMVFETQRMHVPRRLRRWLRSCAWTLHADTDFAAVMAACAQPRHEEDGTWITRDMTRAYRRLHALGHAHSIEVRDADGQLVGGLYGVAIGHMFYAESMFSRATNGSKVALLFLADRLRAWGWPLIDAQVRSEHLMTLGGIEIPRADFVARVASLAAADAPPGSWTARCAGHVAAALAA